MFLVQRIIRIRACQEVNKITPPLLPGGALKIQVCSKDPFTTFDNENYVLNLKGWKDSTYPNLTKILKFYLTFCLIPRKNRVLGKRRYIS